MFGFWIRSVLIICWLIPSECWGARFKIYFYPYSSLETRDHPDMDPGPSLTVQLIRRQALKMHRIRMKGRCLSSVTGAQRRADGWELCSSLRITRFVQSAVRRQINDGDSDNDVENSSWSENNQSRFQAQRLQLASGAPKLLSIAYSVSMALLDTGITSVLFVFFFA